MKLKNSDSVLNPSVAASKLGLPPRLLKKYELEGLIITNKTEHGHNLYSETDLDWIKFLHQKIVDENLKIAGIRLLLSLIPCWELKKDCKEERCKGCDAYKNYNVICWSIDNQKSRLCRKDSCRDCEVYEYAIQPEHIEKMYAVVETKNI